MTLIRQMQIADQAAIIEIMAQAGFSEHMASKPELNVISHTVEQYMEWSISDRENTIFLVAVDGWLVGIAVAQRGSDSVWEAQVGVSIKSQRGGVGRALLAALLQEMKLGGSGTCRSVIHPANLGAVRMVLPYFSLVASSDRLEGFDEYISKW